MGSYRNSGRAINNDTLNTSGRKSNLARGITGAVIRVITGALIASIGPILAFLTVLPIGYSALIESRLNSVIVSVIVGGLFGLGLLRRKLPGNTLRRIIAVLIVLFTISSIEGFLIKLLYVVGTIIAWKIGSFGGSSSSIISTTASQYTPSVPRSSTPSRFENIEWYKPLIFGEAGAHIGSNKEFGDAARMGAVGEKRVGEELNKLATEFQGVAVVHGLRFRPGKDGSDVDHAVLFGNTMYLIDAKLWKIGSYAWINDETVYRDGAQFSGSNVHMAAAVDIWKNYMSGKMKVMSRITLAQYENKKNNKVYHIDNSRSPYTVELRSLNELMKELRAEIKKQGHHVSTLQNGRLERVINEMQR